MKVKEIQNERKKKIENNYFCTSIIQTPNLFPCKTVHTA